MCRNMNSFKMSTLPGPIARMIFQFVVLNALSIENRSSSVVLTLRSVNM